MRASLNPQSSILNPRGGQAMLIAVIAMSGIFLGATAIAGLIMTYQIRITTIAEDSAQAIFAADAGIECGLYNIFNGPASCPGTPGDCLCPLGASLTNNSEYVAEIRRPSRFIISRGFSGTARRAQDIFYGIFE